MTVIKTTLASTEKPSISNSEILSTPASTSASTTPITTTSGATSVSTATATTTTTVEPTTATKTSTTTEPTTTTTTTPSTTSIRPPSTTRLHRGLILLKRGRNQSGFLKVSESGRSISFEDLDMDPEVFSIFLDALFKQLELQSSSTPSARLPLQKNSDIHILCNKHAYIIFFFYLFFCISQILRIFYL